LERPPPQARGRGTSPVGSTPSLGRTIPKIFRHGLRGPAQHGRVTGLDDGLPALPCTQGLDEPTIPVASRILLSPIHGREELSESSTLPGLGRRERGSGTARVGREQGACRAQSGETARQHVSSWPGQPLSTLGTARARETHTNSPGRDNSMLRRVWDLVTEFSLGNSRGICAGKIWILRNIDIRGSTLSRVGSAVATCPPCKMTRER
jgi:hypothetical protein